MNARFAFIDLETAPLGWDGWPNALIQPPEPAVLAIQRRQKKAPSNYVNEDAIQRWHDRQREGAHDAAIKWWRDCALDPKFGEIVCVGLAFNRGDPMVLAERNELETLVALAGQLAVFNPQWIIAHNGNDFDYPFIWERSIAHGLTQLASIFANLPFGTRRQLDLPEPQTRLLDTLRLWQTTRASRENETKRGSRGMKAISDHLRISSDDDIDGSQVLDCLLAGEKWKVERHASCDIVQLQRLWYDNIAPALGVIC